MRTLAALFASTMIGLTALPATAQDLSSPTVDNEEDEDIWALLENIPARRAWDIAAHASFGNMGYWADKSGPYIGFGVRGTYGWIFGGKNRIGPSLGVSIEGPIPIYTTIAFEPQLAWDRASDGFVIGASVGPSVLYHSSEATVHGERAVSLAPMASVRVGYSKPFSRLGKRFFLVVEPKIRYIAGNDERTARPDAMVLLSVGSGQGR